MDPGHGSSLALPDGRTLEYWEGGDPGGRAVVFHPGTPVSRVLGRWAHGAALTAGVRLLSVNRPGYGASTTVTEPSLISVGNDTASLAAELGLDGYAVVGGSGGGPFTVATAIADPTNVRAIGVVGGVGPWRLLDEPSMNAEDRECLALLDAGDVDGAWACFRAQCDRDLGDLEPEAAADWVLSGDASSLAKDDAYRAVWAENMRVVLSRFDGYIYDNLAWGGDWDVDPRDVGSPTVLWYGTTDAHCPPETHGRWYADRIAGSELIVTPSEGHIDVIDGHWPEVLAGVLRIWR